MFKSLRKITNNDLGFLYKIIASCTLDAVLIVAPYIVLIYLLQVGFDANSAKFSSEFIFLFALFIALYVLRTAVSFKTTQTNTKAGYEAGNIVRSCLLKRLEHLPLGYFNKKSTGELHDKIIANVGYIEMMASHFFPGVFTNILAALFALVVIAFLNLNVATILLAAFACAFVFLFALIKFTDEGGARRILKAGILNSKFLEYIQGMIVFKAFGLGGDKFKNLELATRRMKEYSFYFEIRAFLFSTTYDAILDFGLVASALVIFLVAADGKMGADSLNLALGIAIFAIILQFLKSLHDFVTNAALSGGTYAAVKTIAKIYDESILETKNPLEMPNGFEIEFKNVKFDYENKTTIKNLSFIARENSLTAIVGSSGAGKSTIFNLIARFWDVKEGGVSMGGADIRHMDRDRLMQNIAVVFQDTYLFNDSVLENIRIAKPGASRDEIIDACKKANCDEFISSLESGYDTILAEGGKSLSGGQRQRLAVARALLKDAPVLLLDEVTASLDPQNDEKIMKLFNKLKREKTILVISHKLNTIKSADQILLMDNGALLESGKFDDLVATGGRFAEFWHKFECKK